jgi:hypothetical protein
MHTPFVFARFTLKSFIRFDLTERLQGAAFVYRGISRRIPASLSDRFLTRLEGGETVP